MSKPPPLIVVIAGPNGAGKSTFAARLFKLYRPLADEWYVYNNSDYHNPSAIAAGRGAEPERIFRPEEWSQFSRSHQ